MDLAITYRCNDNCAHCYNARPRSHPELPTADWRTILDRLWTIGVPHICFTGGEATLRSDLPDLIAHGHGLGHIVGLLSNGRRLSDGAYVHRLAEAGLDHVQITLESSREEVHDRMVAARGAWRQTIAGIRNALDEGLFVMTNTTLLSDNVDHIEETIDFLAGLGVPTIGCNALIHAGSGATVATGLPEASLQPVLDAVRTRTDGHGQRLIWYTPTQYCAFDPVGAELGVKGCTAARYNMCVEPDGAVIPCQSYYQPVGDIRNDPWESIWNHELSVWLRERRYMADDCRACVLVAECGGGCPLSPAAAASPSSAWMAAGGVSAARG
jgi:radical SAM protein with 4Fe4S-binding SPASM domain